MVWTSAKKHFNCFLLFHYFIFYFTTRALIFNLHCQLILRTSCNTNMLHKSTSQCNILIAKTLIFQPFQLKQSCMAMRRLNTVRDYEKELSLYNNPEGITNYYSTFIHCTNSDFLIGWFVPRDTGLWRNKLLDVIIMV